MENKRMTREKANNVKVVCASVELGLEKWQKHGDALSFQNAMAGNWVAGDGAEHNTGFLTKVHENLWNRVTLD